MSLRGEIISRFGLINDKKWDDIGLWLRAWDLHGCGLGMPKRGTAATVEDDRNRHPSLELDVLRDEISDCLLQVREFPPKGDHGIRGFDAKWNRRLFAQNSNTFRFALKLLNKILPDNPWDILPCPWGTGNETTTTPASTMFASCNDWTWRRATSRTYTIARVIWGKGDLLPLTIVLSTSRLPFLNNTSYSSPAHAAGPSTQDGWMDVDDAEPRICLFRPGLGHF